MVVNGWDNARDNNRSKSVCAQIRLTPCPALSGWFNVMYGPERTGEEHDARQIYDLVTTWKVRERLVLGLNLDYGVEAGAVTPDRDAIWKSAAVYGRVGVVPNLSLAVRVERFHDQDGARTRVVQKLDEITLTPEFRTGGGLIVRADLRLDHSDTAVFDRRAGKHDTQATAILNALYAF